MARDTQDSTIRRHARTRFDTLWMNANVATLAAADPGLGILRDAAVACDEGKIAWLGAAADLPAAPGELAGALVDCGNRWIVPGFVDCHTHLVFGGNRAGEHGMRRRGISYETIARRGGGILATVARTRESAEEELFLAAAGRAWDMIRDGVTTVEIKSGYGLDASTEAKTLRVARRLGEELPLTVRTTFLGAHALPPEFRDDRRGYLDLLCREMLPALAGQGLIDAVDAFCEPIAFSLSEVERVFRAAGRLGLPVKLHAEQLSNSGGARLAARFGALSADHLEHLDEAGAGALADSGTVAVLLPGAFYTLRETRRPPVAALRERGVPMAVATDCNPGSSPLLSLRLAANMSCQLFGLTEEEALRAITSNAARALGMADTVGSLEVGKRADFLICDLGQPSELLYWIGGGLVDSVVKRGEPVGPAPGERNPPVRWSGRAGGPGAAGGPLPGRGLG